MMGNVLADSNSRRHYPRGVHLAYLFVQVNFSALPVAAKYVLAEMDPFAMAGLRVAAATPFLVLAATLVDRRLPAWRDLPMLFLLGILGVTANQLLYISGLQLTTAANSVILMPAIPVFTAAIAALFRVERMRPLRVLGVLLAVAGAVAMLPFEDLGGGGDTLWGNLLIVANCVSYAGFLVLQRPMLRRLPPLTVIAWSFLLGTLLTVVVVHGEMTDAVAAGVSPDALWAFAYIIFIPTCANYALNSWAIGRSSPTLAATYTTLQPPLGTLLAILVLGETLAVRDFFGFALIMAGLLIVIRVPEKEPPRPA